MTAADPGGLLDAVLRSNPAAPLITYYDDASGERAELSATTLANWVAKTANLLQEEFDVGRGSRVAVALPVHWQTAAVLLAAWSCGALVVDTAIEDEDALGDVDVLLTAQDRLEAVETQDDEGAQLLGLSLHPMGLGMTGYAGAARDYALEVRVHGDVFMPYEPPDPAAPGLVVGELELSIGGLVEAARELGRRLGLRSGDRVLMDETTAAEAGPVVWLLAPLAAGASLVLCRHTAPEKLAARAATERVTATLGPDIPGVRVLGRGGRVTQRRVIDSPGSATSDDAEP